MDTKSQKLISGSVLGAILAVIFITLLTIAGDLYSPLKNFLKEAHYHHWIGKGIWATILFVVVLIGYIVFVKIPDINSTNKLIKMLIWVTVFGTVILTLFFVYEYFKH